MRRALLIGFFACLVVMAASRPVVAGPAIVFDAKSGTVLYADDVDQAWYPASLTKLMTAYLTFEALRAGKLKMTSRVVSTKTSLKQQPSKIGLPVGNSLPVSLALQALIIKSANDVAVMLAQKIGGSVPGFVAKMNATAKRLGMARTRFYNPNGLPHAKQVTTARDMGKLTYALIKEFPEHAALFSKKIMRLGKIPLRTHNKLLKTFPGADGMKTGFICASGFNVVASATRNGRRLVAVVLGGLSAAERNKRTAALLEHAFSNYLWKSFFQTANIKTLPLAASDSVKPVNMRRTVKAWVCGYRGPKTKTKKIKIKRKRTKKKKSAVFLGSDRR